MRGTESPYNQDHETFNDLGRQIYDDFDRAAQEILQKYPNVLVRDLELIGLSAVAVSASETRLKEQAEASRKRAAGL